MSFSSLKLPPALVKALSEQQYTKPYPIQKQVIPSVLNGKDILGIAQTGSGKTASYVLPILTNLLGKTQSKSRHINVLVLVPTRELAVQVQEVFHLFSKALPEPIKSMAVFGGASINPQMKALFGVNILVATPGRLLELVDTNAIHLSDVSTLVLDEADKMLNMGFKEEVDKILAALPKNRQNLLFSATLSKEVEHINQLVLKSPQVIKIVPAAENIDLIGQIAYRVREEQKGPLLRYLIKTEEMNQVLIFTSSVYKADNVADKLRKNGIDAKATHGKKSMKARTDALRDFKSGVIKVLVTTDLLSRGIDIEFLPFVINYELPRSPKDYVHRIGRTGRAENPGKAISILTPEDDHHFKIIQKKMKKQVEVLNKEEIDLAGY